MIPRYSPSDVAALFSDENRFDSMLEVEILAAEGLASLGVLPATEVGELRRRRPAIDAAFVAAVDERELTTNHDTAAFVDIVQGAIGMPEGAWIHYGLTSSDVVDTALCSTLTKAMDIVITEATALRDALTRRAVESIDIPITGRTHGMHAEPTTYGAKFSLFALRLQWENCPGRWAPSPTLIQKLRSTCARVSVSWPCQRRR
jgi:adenylosuccinate lyase